MPARRRAASVPGRHQSGLDSALDLLAVRREILPQIDDRGRTSLSGVEVIGIGATGIQRALRSTAERSTECLATHPGLVAREGTRQHDRDFVLRGGTIRNICGAQTPVSDPPELQKAYLTDDVLGRGNFSAPVAMQMIISNRASVLLDGPRIGDEQTVMAVSDTRVIRAAFDYWARLQSLAVPMSALLDPDPLAGLSPRQRDIVTMLADDLTDTAIAGRLDLSLRTVQSEVATVLRTVGARSRFGAGMRLGALACGES